MKIKIFSILIVSIFTFHLFAEERKPYERTYIKSNNAKLYKILRLIDDRTEWLKVSELLREILASHIKDPFVREQLTLAKYEIDSEAIKAHFRERVLDKPFIVAKFRIIEAMMANHSRLNISYDQEVPLIKGLLKTYFFPGEEEDGEIIFPDKSTYSFDVYGYIKENILKTETAPSGVIEDPRFPEVVQKVKEKIEELERQGKPNFISPENVHQDLTLVQEIIELAALAWGLGSETVKDLFRVTRVQNQYEPWAMLMQVIANPDSVYEDPQLQDFLKGVKLKLKVGEFPYNCEEQAILKDLLSSPRRDTGLAIEEDVTLYSDKIALYVTTNLAGHGMLHFKYLMYLKKILEIYPEVKPYSSVLVTLAEKLKNLGQAAVWYRRILAAPANVLGFTVFESARLCSDAAQHGRVVALLGKVQNWWIIKNDRYFKFALMFALAGDLAEGSLQYLVAIDKYDRQEALKVTVAKEFTHILYGLPLVSQRAIFRYAGWGAFALDMGVAQAAVDTLSWGIKALDYINIPLGYWVNLDIEVPKTHELIKAYMIDVPLDHFSQWFYGETLNERKIREFEHKIKIYDDESFQNLALFSLTTQKASQGEQLVVSKEAFSQNMKAYANRRLFLIYYLIQRWNNQEVCELGLTERKYWGDYQKYRENLKTAKMRYDEKTKILQSSN